MEKKILITNKTGLHGETASGLAQLAKKLNSEVIVCKDGKEGDARSVFNLMALRISQGSEITVKLNGGDEEGNLKRIMDYLEDLKDTGE